MNLNNSSGDNESREEMKNHLNNENVNQSDWDNDTYGHSPDASAFKRKNEPDEKHIEYLKDISDDSAIDSSKELKNINLANGDLSGESADNEKGLGGKVL